MNEVIDLLRELTASTPYEGSVYVVGGALRDRALGLPPRDDLDLVVDGDALALAALLHERGPSAHYPVIYERFGTAKINLGGVDIELVSARAESYAPDSRKPSVLRAELLDDALRRDFTINTLMENLHTGEVLDLTGRARKDLKERVIRTPREPRITFRDDPLRMLRAVRFAGRFSFEIDPATWRAVVDESHRLNLMGLEQPVVSAERIRDEIVKIMLGPDAAGGLELLRSGNLLAQFAPELLEMVGVEQNAWHSHDVWDHTMLALRAAPAESSLELRLGVLFHDVGKPRTRSEDARGVHFYEHQFVGAQMTREILHRLRFRNDLADAVVDLVKLHMRLGEARPDWSDSAVKRLIRDTHPHTDTLFGLARCDILAMNPDVAKPDLDALASRIAELNRLSDVARIGSPLDGSEIMAILGIGPGPRVGAAKEFLANEVIDGQIAENDKQAATESLLRWAAP